METRSKDSFLSNLKDSSEQTMHEFTFYIQDEILTALQPFLLDAFCLKSTYYSKHQSFSKTVVLEN